VNTRDTPNPTIKFLQSPRFYFANPSPELLRTVPNWPIAKLVKSNRYLNFYPARAKKNTYAAQLPLSKQNTTATATSPSRLKEKD
jgi:hypothetical protein